MEQRYLETEENATVAPLLRAPGQAETVTQAEAVSNVEADKLQEIKQTPDTLPALLEREIRLQQRDTGLIGLWAAAFLILTTVIALQAIVDVSQLQLILGVLFTLMMVVGLPIYVNLFRRALRRKRVFMEALTRERDVNQIGALVRTLRVENNSVRNMAKQALIKLLPNLRASDASLLGDQEREILLRQLAIAPTDPGYRHLKELFSSEATHREIALRIAILQAMEQVGGAKELTTVEMLARGQFPLLPGLNRSLTQPGSTRSIATWRLRSDAHEVQIAAQQCLPFLQARANEQIASSQLLRASSAENTSGEMLLRPLAATSDAEGDQLLRASQKLI
jgi:hypothetical protein